MATFYSERDTDAVAEFNIATDSEDHLEVHHAKWDSPSGRSEPCVRSC